MRFIREDGEDGEGQPHRHRHARLRRARPRRRGRPRSRSARAYEIAKATIERGSDKSENALRAERASSIVAQRHKGEHLVYSPAGA